MGGSALRPNLAPGRCGIEPGRGAVEFAPIFLSVDQVYGQFATTSRIKKSPRRGRRGLGWAPSPTHPPGRSTWYVSGTLGPEISQIDRPGRGWDPVGAPPSCHCAQPVRTFVDANLWSRTSQIPGTLAPRVYQRPGKIRGADVPWTRAYPESWCTHMPGTLTYQGPEYSRGLVSPYTWGVF